MPLLEVNNLVTRFYTKEGTVHAVNGISFTLDVAETLAIVGESGSGKSVSMLSLMGLIPSPPGRIESGEVLFNGLDLLGLADRQLRDIRGNDIAMIFQDPMTSLNPVLTIGRQMSEGLRRHLGLNKKEARARAVELLSLVGIPNPKDRLRDYPHRFSGGQRQRIMIAMALSCDPQLLIADEPTTALDVTIQAQIIELVNRLKAQIGMAIIWITHDLAVVAGLVDRVGVMYAGHLVELAPVRSLYNDTSHPYTLGLLESLPKIDVGDKAPLVPIDGAPPDLYQEPASCAFAPRCRFAVERCWQEVPPLVETGADHFAACFRWDVVREEAHE